MNLPNLENAIIPDAKIADYLLSDTHPDGKHKARMFRALGFSSDDCSTLQQAVLQHASDHEITKVESSPFGTRYVIEGIMQTPDGRLPLVRCVWFIRNNEDSPYFVTAYPLGSNDDD